MTRSQSVRPTSIAIERTHTSGRRCWPSIRRSSARCRKCCGRVTMFRISSSIALGLLVTTAAFADDNRYENTLHANVTWKGGRVTIEHKFGHVDVRTNSGDAVTVRGIVRASDEELGKLIHLEVSNGSHGVSIRRVYPDVHSHRGNTSYSADLEVTIPERAPLLLKNRFGSVQVQGLRAASEIVNGQGSIEFRDSRGTQRIENSFGSVTIVNSGGDTTVQNANGSVSIDRIDGNLVVTDRFASVTVKGAKKPVTIQNSNGSVELNDVGADARVPNAFGSVGVSDVDGSLQITNQNGSVDVRAIKGAAVIKNSDG